MPNVTLRPLRDDDVAPLTAILAESSVRARWREWNEERVRKELVSPCADEHLTVWGVVVDEALAGAIQLGEQPDPEYRHASIDLFLSEAWQGRGVGPRAIALVVDIAFGDRGHHRLVIDPALDNENAIRAYARMGFHTVGRVREYEIGEGGFHDGLLMERLRDDPRDFALPLGDVVLRPATPNDDEEIAAMAVALYQEDPGQRAITRDDVKRTLRHFLLHPERGAALVIERDGAMLGYGFVCAFWSNELGGLIAIVDELYLKPDARGQGVGSRVLDAIAAGMVPGFANVVATDLEVTPDNARAKALYERLGFRAMKNRGMRRRT